MTSFIRTDPDRLIHRAMVLLPFMPEGVLIMRNWGSANVY
jgi:hypothetical protein